MAKAEHAKIVSHKSYSKRMSDNVAFALVIYTLMLIFVVTPSMESEGTSIFPYFMLVVFVGLVISPCHGLERRWQALQNNASGDGMLDSRFNIDRAILWFGAIGIPVIIAAICYAITLVA